MTWEEKRHEVRNGPSGPLVRGMMPSLSDDDVLFVVNTTERMAKMETKIDALMEQFCKHQEAHEWWFRLLVGALVTGVVNLVVSIVR